MRPGLISVFVCSLMLRRRSRINPVSAGRRIGAAVLSLQSLMKGRYC